MLADMWLNIAGANGKADARERRDELERDMTHAEISRATPRRPTFPLRGRPLRPKDSR